MRLLAPAKINLHLRVGPARHDGFHPLLSWFCTVGLFDILTLEPSARLAAGSEPSQSLIRLTCDQPDIPGDERNLVVRVANGWAQEMGDATGSQIAGLSASLQKRIPAGAGLGGGSSDGAFSLMGVNRLWKTEASAEGLAEFAAKFGSDLPFFFHGPSSVCKGRGEVVTPISPPAPRWALLVLPGIAMPTPQVYRQFDALNLGSTQDLDREPDWRAWAQLDAAHLLPLLINDLEPPAFAIEPRLGELRANVEETIKRPVRMSGSGSSLFSLFDSEPQAQDMAKNVIECHRVRAIAVELAPRWKDDLSI